MVAGTCGGNGFQTKIRAFIPLSGLGVKEKKEAKNILEHRLLNSKIVVLLYLKSHLILCKLQYFAEAVLSLNHYQQLFTLLVYPIFQHITNFYLIPCKDRKFYGILR